MFGKSFDEKVREALDEVRREARIRDLDAKIDGKTVTLTGEAPDMAAKTRAMVLFNEKVETENTMNMIRVAQPAATATKAPTLAPPAGSPADLVGPPPPPTGAGPAVTRAEGAAAARVHEVQKGDTLSAIAKKYYGKASDYPRIFEANRDILKDPDRIYPGQKLQIPN